jgi:putative mRNA 3-end processing factor
MLIRETPRGLYCAAGDFYVDPWRPVDRAVVSHAHADHARPGSQHYLASEESVWVLRRRLQSGADIQTLPYNTPCTINGVQVSFHPAGHILGSAQVRIEHRGEVWVLSGDYKIEPDTTCTPFEPVRCHTFVTESTFGLPVYRWGPTRLVAEVLNRWWQQVAAEGRNAVVFAYALGKAQRVLSLVDPGIGPIYCHGAVQHVNEDYRQTGRPLPATSLPPESSRREKCRGALVIAPPGAAGSPWLRRFGEAATAMASGWMAIRGLRRRRGVDRGFVISDHADWPGLLAAIRSTGAERVLVTHGSTTALSRYLREQGLASESLNTEYRGEQLVESENETGSEPPAESEAS